MPEIRPVGASSKVNMLIHTDMGWGKTSFIGSGGQEYKIWLIRPPIDHTDSIIGSGVMESVVTNWEETFETLDQARHEGHEWDFICLDSISLLQDVGLDDVYEGVLDRKGPVGSLARKDREKFGPDQGEYRVNMWRLGQWVRHMVGAQQTNLIITAHTFFYTPKQGSPDEETVEPSMYPWIQGKAMPSKICGMMNIVAFGDIRLREVRGEKREMRVLHTNKTENYYAKCQFRLPVEGGVFRADGPSVFGSTGDIYNPTLPEMMEKIKQGRPVSRSRGRRPRPSHGGAQIAQSPVVRRRTRREQ